MQSTAVCFPTPACCQCGSTYSKNLMIAIDSRAVHCADCLLGNERANRNALEGYAAMLENQHQIQLEHLRQQYDDRLAALSQGCDKTDERIAIALTEQKSNLMKMHESEKEQMRRSQRERISQVFALENCKADEKLKIALSKQRAALTEKLLADNRVQQQSYDQRMASARSATVKEQTASLQKAHQADLSQREKAYDVKIDELEKRLKGLEQELARAKDQANALSRQNAKLLTDKKIQKDELLQLLSKKNQTIDRLTGKQTKASKEVEELTKQLKQEKWHLKAMQNQQEPLAAQLVMVTHQKQTIEEQLLDDRKEMQRLQDEHRGAVHQHTETMKQMREHFKRVLLQNQSLKEKEKKCIEEAAKFVYENAAIMVLSQRS